MKHFKTSLIFLSFLNCLSSCLYSTTGHQLIKTSLSKITQVNKFEMSSTSYNSYVAFSKKFTTLMLNKNNSEEEKSYGVSIPDAYICFAISGIISSDSARDEVISYLGLKDEEELKTSTKEIITALGTLYKDPTGRLSGGCNFNSIWLDPNQVELLEEKNKELYDDLQNIFDTSLYNETLTSDKANKYFKDNKIGNLPTPNIEFDDSNSSPISVMSLYSCIDYFSKEEKDVYLNHFKENKKINYFYKNDSKQVSYIPYNSNGIVYENEAFYGSELHMEHLNMEVFLPKERQVMPSSILNDVLNNNYTFKKGNFTDYDNEVRETNIFDVTLNVPYFSLDNKCELDKNTLKDILPTITSSGLGEKLVRTKSGDNLYLDSLKQFSLMNFNYDGFYSASATIASGEAEMGKPLEYEKFSLIFDHPYLFKVNRRISVDSNTKNMPLVIGEIVDPNYIETK